jgi:hypothetical protein
LNTILITECFGINKENTLFPGWGDCISQGGRSIRAGRSVFGGEDAARGRAKKKRNGAMDIALFLSILEGLSPEEKRSRPLYDPDLSFPEGLLFITFPAFLHYSISPTFPHSVPPFSNIPSIHN